MESWHDAELGDDYIVIRRTFVVGLYPSMFKGISEDRSASVLINLSTWLYARYIQSTCATSGEGLYEGLDWLSNNIASKA
ncbi:hypothetical protein NC651_020242 [Populus alba x Populus x berolinensis]|nr:hypothetical protein NC651_020242 [Populus alba x Populus x berolinensis]